MKQIPRKTWDNYINKLSRIDKTAGKKVQAFISKNGIPATAAETSRLIDYSYGLVQTYGSASAALACEMYDSLSRIEGAKVPPAEPAELATYGETAKAINGTLKNSVEAALVPGAVERLTKMAGADTMLKNAIRDGAEWAWIPNGDTCVFCLTLASRGWQPASKAILDGGHAEHIHAHCDCTFMIRHDSNMNVQGYDPDKIREQYEAHNGDLNEWRRELYAKKLQRNEINNKIGDMGAKDVTEVWKNRAITTKPNVEENPKSVVYDGKEYIVDGHNVILDHDQDEKNAAKLLSRATGEKVVLCPRICGQNEGVSTPDYIVGNNIKWDRKGLSGKGKDALRDVIKKKARQADNFLIDISKWQGEESNILDQAKRVFTSSNTNFVSKLMVVKDGEIIKALER